MKTNSDQKDRFQADLGKSAGGSLQKPGKTRGKWKSFIAFFVCLVLAFLVWLYVMNVDSPLYEETFTAVPVEIVTRAADGTETPLSAISGAGVVTDVKLRGRKTVMDEYTAGEIHAYIDISGQTETGRGSYPIMIDAPSGTTVVEYEPREASLYLDRKSTKTVPVTVEVTDYTYSSDCYIGDKIPAISSVIVTGPESELAQVAAAQITLSPGGTVDRTFTGTAAPILLDEQGKEVTSRFLSVNAAQIQATVKVMTAKTVPVTVSFKNGYFNTSNVSLQIEPAEIRISGEVSNVETVESIEALRIDEQQVDKSSWTRNVTLSLPEGVEVDETSRSVTVTLTVADSMRAVSVVGCPITVMNAPDDLSYEISSDVLTVSVRGTTDKISEVKAEDLVAVLDLKNISKDPGQYQMPVSVTVRGGDSKKLFVIGDYSVTVTVK